MYLKGVAKKWFFTRFKNIRALRWDQFKLEVTRRFTEQGYHNVVAELHELRQIGNVEEYQSKFEDLKSQVLKKEPALTETYFISTFIGGLQGELRNFVQMMKPLTLDEAIAMARLQEGGFNTLLAKARGNTTSSTKTNSNQKISSTNNTTKSQQSITTSSQTTAKPYQPNYLSSFTNPYKSNNKNTHHQS